MRLRPENVNEVFQSLVKMGDVAHALRDDSIPMPTITLTAQTYAETMLTHLRPPYRDVENFAESVDAYDLDDDDFRSASPWLDVDALENIRVDLKKQAARVTDDRCDGILRRWNTAKDTLVELAKYCGEILEAMGPSFLERVAADFRSGRYAPPSADGVLIPEDAIPEGLSARTTLDGASQAQGIRCRQATRGKRRHPRSRRRREAAASRARHRVREAQGCERGGRVVEGGARRRGQRGRRRRRWRGADGGGGVERPSPRNTRRRTDRTTVGRVPGAKAAKARRAVSQRRTEEGRRRPHHRGATAHGGLGFGTAAVSDVSTASDDEEGDGARP